MMSNVCSICNKSFECVDKYSRHLKLNTCKEPYNCIACEYVTKRKDHYERHLNTKKCKNNTEKINKSERYKCSICNRTFRDSFNLNSHQTRNRHCSQEIINITNNNQTNVVQQQNNFIINAHDPNAFLKDLNHIDKAIYNNLLQSYSINSPESLALLEEVAKKEYYQEVDDIDEEKINKLPEYIKQDIENKNNMNICCNNNDYMSRIITKAFFNPNQLKYAPFFRVPNSKEIKIKYNDQLHKFDDNILYDLIDNFVHKMKVIKKEENLSLYTIQYKIDEAYNKFRCDFIKLLKLYRNENRRLHI